MKTIHMLTSGLLVVFLGLITACSGTFNITADYDKTADFSKYKTFNFIPGSDSTMGPGAMRFKQYVIDYMQLLGYELAEKPDLYVAINGHVEQKIGVTSSPSYGYYGYWGWPDYYTQAYTYNETTVVIDLIDARKHQLVWQGVAQGEFDQFKMTDSKAKQLVDEVFGQYPFMAGTSKKRPLIYKKYYKKPEVSRKL